MTKQQLPKTLVYSRIGKITSPPTESKSSCRFSADAALAAVRFGFGGNVDGAAAVFGVLRGGDTEALRCSAARLTFSFDARAVVSLFFELPKGPSFRGSLPICGEVSVRKITFAFLADGEVDDETGLLNPLSSGCFAKGPFARDAVSRVEPALGVTGLDKPCEPSDSPDREAPFVELCGCDLSTFLGDRDLDLVFDFDRDRDRLTVVERASRVRLRLRDLRRSLSRPRSRLRLRRWLSERWRNSDCDPAVRAIGGDLERERVVDLARCLLDRPGLRDRERDRERRQRLDRSSKLS